MSGCKFMGKPKVKHATKALAYEHLSSPGNSGIHLRQIYECRECGYWHIGRKPTPKRLRHELRRPELTDERLVGQLIGTLKRVINKEQP